MESEYLSARVEQLVGHLAHGVAVILEAVVVPLGVTGVAPEGLLSSVRLLLLQRQEQCECDDDDPPPAHHRFGNSLRLPSPGECRHATIQLVGGFRL